MTTTETTVEIRGQQWSTGCYVDGHWGIYGIGRTAEIADSVLGGSRWSDEYSANGAEDFEFVGDLADEIENALNEVTPEPFSWGWHDGEFFLWPQETWEE